MKQWFWSVALAVAVPWVGGCAVVEENAAASDPRTYVTGSNIGRRADQSAGSKAQALSGEQLRTGQTRLPDLVPAPDGYRGTGN